MSRTASRTCGQPEIIVAGEPGGVGRCHCLARQSRTGSVFAALAGFEPPWRVEGVAAEYVHASGRAVFRFYLEHGTNLFHTEMGGWPGASVAVGAFADPSFTLLIGYADHGRRHAWVSLPETVTRHDRDPD